MRASALALSVLLLAAGFAGCVATTGSTDPAAATGPTSGLVDADGLLAGAPVVSAADTLATLVEFSKGFPKRNSNNEAHNGARDYLENAFKEAGLETYRQELTAAVSPTSTPTGLVGGGKLVNIIGIKWGEDRDNWIVIGGHYDVTDAAIEGAYDDGSGTAMTVELAKAFSKMDTYRTIAFVMFDGEEQGLKGSSFFVEDWKAGSFPYKMEVYAMIDLDMFGINWPTETPMLFDDNSPELRNITERLRLREGIPDDMIEYRGISAGRSDYGPFMAADVPAGFFISQFDDVRYRGQQIPQVGPLGTYPWWHRLDTVETMTEFAGGPEALEASFQVALNLATGLLHEVTQNRELVLTLEAPEE